MATPRRPLGEINGNSRRGKDLTPVQRALLEGARRVGASWADIAKEFDIPQSTVRSTIKLASVRIYSTT
jgi:DNA-directed RNA polymerase specialized sigma24 family protein